MPRPLPQLFPFPRWEVLNLATGRRLIYLPFLSPIVSPFSLPLSPFTRLRSLDLQNLQQQWSFYLPPQSQSSPLVCSSPQVSSAVTCLLTTRLSADPPDSITIPEFVFSDKYGRKPLSRSRRPYTCGITGKSYTTSEVEEREKLLARALAKRLGYDLTDGTEWDRVLALYSLNTVRIPRAVV